MASITSMMSGGASSMSSIYGNRNVLSGLASGMDTESMIENAVSGIKLKIQNLTRKRTKIEWQQEAYRSIIDKAVNFTTKYTSYSSKTNLLSSSFFSNAVNTTVKGTYADKLTATGKTTSDVKIHEVKQLATAASYSVSGLGDQYVGEILGINAAEGLDLEASLDVSNLSGTLTFQYGGKNGTTFDIKFDELENLNDVVVYNADGTKKTDATNAEKLAQAINDKLSEITYNYTDKGFQETTTADKAVKVVADATGRLTFRDGLGKGNTVKISSSSGKIKDYASENVIAPPKKLTSEVPTYEYLAGKKDDNGKWSGGKELGITLNGTTKKINMSDVMNEINLDSADVNKNERFKEVLQSKLDEAFGTGKITVGQNDGKLSLTPGNKGDMLSLGGSALEALGFTKDDTNYINTGKKLSELLDEGIFSTNNRLKAEGEVKESANGKYFVDQAGNRVRQDEDGEYYRVNNDGEFLYDFKVNGANINVTKDTTLESLMNSINSNAEAGVKVSYSKLTNQFKFTATETGANGKVEFGGLAERMFGDTKTDGTYTEGTDAVMDVEINGTHIEDFTRSSNTFDFDGLKVTVKGTFKAEGKDGADYEPITFESATDSDKIVDAIREFVNDYNEMATELKNAYSTMPAQKSNGARYEPLTAEEESQYSESELKAYNEKAKQGILFGDSTLSSMYSKLLSAITPGGTDGQTLREIGLSTSYSNGMTTLSLDESKLRAALESDPDKVRTAFTKTKEGGSTSDGLMMTMQNTLNTYVKNTGEPKGVLIQRAGSIKAPTSLNNNTLKSQMDNIDNEVDRWTDKMANQIDRYTTQFSRLEQLIAQMNAQSSAMAGLMGGSGGY